MSASSSDPDGAASGRELVVYIGTQQSFSAPAASGAMASQWGQVYDLVSTTEEESEEKEEESKESSKEEESGVEEEKHGRTLEEMARDHWEARNVRC